MKDDQRVVLTKRLLREGLLRLLEEKELEDIRVSELCAVSGINRATFYRHYAQPRDILRDLRRDMIGDVQAIAEKDRAEENIQKWLEDICGYFYERADLLRLLFKTRTDEEFVETIQNLYAERQDGFQKSGFAKKWDDGRLRLANYFCAGGFYYILRQWIMEPVEKTPKEVAELICAFLAQE